MVVTSGFAGGLNPTLATGTVVFEADDPGAFRSALLAAGVVPARFHCAERIAVTAAEKRELRQATGADAVEMESAVIRRMCCQHGIPSATVRVISDAADEDLPLNFNRLLTAGLRLNYATLAWTLARSPAKIAALARFQRRVKTAAENLASVLLRVLPTAGVSERRGGP
jgi:uridine phosphorylase